MRQLLLILLLVGWADAATLPDPLRTGSATIAASLLVSGSQYVGLGRPAALTTALAPNHEFTILVRTARALAVSSGQIISCGDSTTVQLSLSSVGGSRVSATIGGTAIQTAPGLVTQPTWNSIALVNRNASGTYMGRIVIDKEAGSTETTVGTSTSARDFLIGARRNTTNTDATGFYSGNIGDVVIWNYALTDDQIHYCMGYIQPNEFINGLYGTGLVALYPCNETSGTTLHDCIAGNDGTCSTSGLFSVASWCTYPAVFIGDSLSNGSGSETGQPYGYQVVGGGSGTRNMRSAYAYGFSGQNVAYIATQTALASFQPFRNWTHIWYVGIHDLGSNSAVTTFLANEIAALPHQRYLIVGNRPNGPVGVVSGVGTPTASGAHDWGTTARGQIDSMNYLIQGLYGSRWISSQAIAVGQASLPAEANDVFQLRSPTHTCADATHALDVGQIALSQAVAAALTSRGW